MATPLGVSPLTLNFTEILSARKERLPVTVTLNTVDASKKIELSTDGGTLFFQPTYNTSNASQLVVTIGAPVTHVKFTGAITDTYTIL
jgi:hypothetical protein